MTEAWQELLFESLEWVAPEIAALAAGFAVLSLDGSICITPAGERYLERLST